ncbi:hypothetical protein ACLOJK_035078 [Asimina triloba]
MASPPHRSLMAAFFPAAEPIIFFSTQSVQPFKTNRQQQARPSNSNLVGHDRDHDINIKLAAPSIRPPPSAASKADPRPIQQTQAGTHHEQPPDHPSDPNRPARSH